MTASQTVPVAAPASAPDALAVLRQYFGFADFKPGQREVIGHLLAGKSAAAVFPTGGGKSLCYQLPALVLPGLTLGRLAADRLDERPDRRPGGPRHRRAAARFDPRPGRIPHRDGRGPLGPAEAAVRRPRAVRQRAVLRDDPADGDLAVCRR